MTRDEFTVILDRRLESIRSTLIAKRAEYAPDSDVLSNFKDGAALLNSTPAKTLLGYLLKHWVSLIGIVERQAFGMLDAERVDEKIGDAMCYLVLLEALLKEAPANG